MGIKRIVDTQFWNDDKVIDYFSPEDKLFMLYLMTNPHTTQLGIYSINEKVIAFELGYSNDTVSVLLDRFENKYKIIKYSKETKEIAIKNFLKYSIIKGGKPVEDLLKKEINQVKDKKLIKFVYENLINYSSLNETVKNILNTYNENEIHNDNDNDNDNEKSYHDTYDDTSKRFKKPTIEEITAYCKERNNNINPNKFYEFYETKNWYVGKTKMKSWKACIRLWEQRDKETTKGTTKLPNWFDKDFKERERTDDEKRELQELIRGY